MWLYSQALSLRNSVMSCASGSWFLKYSFWPHIVDVRVKGLSSHSVNTVATMLIAVMMMMSKGRKRKVVSTSLTC